MTKSRDNAPPGLKIPGLERPDLKKFPTYAPLWHFPRTLVAFPRTLVAFPAGNYLSPQPFAISSSCSANHAASAHSLR